MCSVENISKIFKKEKNKARTLKAVVCSYLIRYTHTYGYVYMP